LDVHKIDSESKGFFFTELGYESNSMDYWSIDSQDFKEKLERIHKAGSLARGPSIVKRFVG